MNYPAASKGVSFRISRNAPRNGKRKSKPTLINLNETGALGLIHSLEEG
jgi:hypothetical protein